MSFGDNFGFEAVQQPECPGVFMRYINESFTTATGYRWVQELRLLKRLSCTGCAQCGGFKDYMAEHQIQVETDVEHRDVVKLTWHCLYHNTHPESDGDDYIVLAVKHQPPQ